MVAAGVDSARLTVQADVGLEDGEIGAHELGRVRGRLDLTMLMILVVEPSAVLAMRGDQLRLLLQEFLFSVISGLSCCLPLHLHFHRLRCGWTRRLERVSSALRHIFPNRLNRLHNHVVSVAVGLSGVLLVDKLVVLIVGHNG